MLATEEEGESNNSGGKEMGHGLAWFLGRNSAPGSLLIKQGFSDFLFLFLFENLCK
jgi:hypothetical protein